MTFIRINDGSMLELLLTDLRARPDVIATAVAANRARINLLGSYTPSAMLLATEPRIRAWESKQRSEGARRLRGFREHWDLTGPVRRGVQQFTRSGVKRAANPCI
jgi:hypothetical protein